MPAAAKTLRLPDNEELLRQWRDGDVAAAEALFNLYQVHVYRLALSLLGQAADAEDIAQDVLTFVLLNPDRYDPTRARFLTWLNVVTVSRCRDRQRKKRHRMLSFFDWFRREDADLPDPSPSPERAAFEHERHDLLWDAVQQLSPLLREALVLRMWSGHSYQEIAAIVDCPLRTAQSRVRLALKKLRPLIEHAQLADSLSEEAIS